MLRTSKHLLGFVINRPSNHETQQILSAIRQMAHPTYTSSGSYRWFTQSSVNYIDQTPASDSTPKIGELTEYHAFDMIHKLSDNDRKVLSKALSRYDSEKTKSKLQGKSKQYEEQ